jgi:ubiquinone/menaquinone biosynthesis C-methylase UbiE
MVKLYLNRSVFYRSKKSFSCIYHSVTGWYYPCKPDFWKTLQSYKGGREVEPQNLSSALSALVRTKFLIEKKTDPPSDYLGFYPIRVPGTVYYEKDDFVIVAVERKGAHGEIDFDVVRLEGAAAEIWKNCTGRRSLREIFDELSIPEGDGLKILAVWTSLESQMARLISQPATEIKQPPPQLIYKAPFLLQKTAATPHAEDVHRYHLETIKDGTVQFDRIESTVSHLYRRPHPILDGRSYGQAFLKNLREEKEVEPGCVMLEVGGGMGSVSADIMAGLKKEGTSVEYVIYDLSPELIRSQQKMHSEKDVQARHILGNGEFLALKDESVDIALSNEVVADFSTPEVKTSEVQDFLFDREIPMTKEFFNHYNDAPESVRVNLGAFQLLKELMRVLKPGGLAVITEFGYQDRLPFRAGHLDHAEYSIQFSQMISVAAALGFNLYLTDAFDFLGFRSDVSLITAFSYQAAYRIMEHLGVYLPNMTYTAEMLEAELGSYYNGFRGLGFVDVNKDPFKVVKFLVCHKPESIPQDPA